MVNSDSSNLAAEAKARLVNYPIASLFQQVDVLLDGNLISSSTNTYPYRAILEVLSGYEQVAKTTFNFKYFSTFQLAMCLNGEMPAPPLKFSFSDNQYIDG